MIYPDITSELRDLIRQRVASLVTRDYALLDVPYYDNPGDTLIWEGTRRMLAELPYRCVRCTDCEGFGADERLPQDTLILMQGGGNWGDLWPRHQEFRRRVIASHPNHDVVVLPQSVHYDDPANLEADKEFFARHRAVTVCARDARSAEILEDILPGRVILAPDMAFFVDVNRLGRNKHSHKSGRTLLAMRADKEAPSGLDPASLPDAAETSDWPQMLTGESPFHADYQRKLRWTYRLRHLTRIDRVTGFRDRYYQYHQRGATLKWSVKWLDQFDTIYSTRLHIAILAILLGKDVHILDNSYRKVTQLIDTWYGENGY